MAADHHEDAGISQRVRHIESMLEDRGIIAGGELEKAIEAFLATSTPLNGARLVAHAWVDPGFKERLLSDANTAIGELGLSMGGGLQEQRLKVVENTAETHNVIVCTLCSCYPIALLGPSPGWYKSEAYRSRVVRDPRGVLREFGLELPRDTTVTVWDSSAESRYMVLPRRPADSETLPEDQLVPLVTRNGLIGTAVV
ncbi:MAG: nitrile hydratase subunit alpha [Chloroflexota bacterium]